MSSGDIFSLRRELSDSETLASASEGWLYMALASAHAVRPGPLTLVFTAEADVQLYLGDRDYTIAVRVPDQADTRELLRQTGPLAVSSANLSGQPPATSIDDAIAQLGDSVAVYLDAGPAPGPVPSTIIDLTGSGGGRILRSGLLSFAELSAVLPTLTEDSGTKPAGSVQAAGQERGSETERPPDA